MALFAFLHPATPSGHLLDDSDPNQASLEGEGSSTFRTSRGDLSATRKGLRCSRKGTMSFLFGTILANQDDDGKSSGTSLTVERTRPPEESGACTVHPFPGWDANRPSPPRSGVPGFLLLLFLPVLTV